MNCAHHRRLALARIIRLPLLLGVTPHIVLSAMPAAAADQQTPADDPPIVVKAERNGDAVAFTGKMDIRASIEQSWNVFTDYDHMTTFLPNLDSSRVVSKDGTTWRVEQQGKENFGPFSFAFRSMREITLTPFREIRSHQLSGTLKQSDAVTQLAEKDGSTQVSYQGSFTPDSSLVFIAGMSVVEREIRNQFEQFRKEVERRKAALSKADLPKGDATRTDAAKVDPP